MSEVVANPAPEQPNAGDASLKADPVVETKPPAEPEKAKPEEKKPDAEVKPETKAPEAEKPVTPEKYDLKIPEGSHLNAERVASVESFAKEKGLSNEEAQVFLDRENEAVSSYVDGTKKQLDHLADVKWPEMVKADPEIGGEHYAKNVELSHRALAAFGSPALSEELKNTGYGNHPELVRAFYRIGKAMSEDKLVIPGSLPAEPKPMHEIFYGNSNKKE